MPALIVVLLFRLIISAIGAFKSRANEPKPLCLECSFAHIQFAACGRRAISCTYGGVVRPMKLNVLYCTDYRPKIQPPRPAMGFVPEIGAAP